MINPTFKNSNILIIYEQVANICFLESYLQKLGYINIKTTTDSRNVVPLFRAFEPDLILLDLSIPYSSGIEVLKKLKSLILAKAFVPIVVIATDITNEAKQQALSGGANDFLSKPFDLIEAGQRISNLLFCKYLVEQIENQSQILEEKVNARTGELEQNNIELIAAREKAEASNRLKTAFLNNISHVIRTPLNGILGFTPITPDPSFSMAKKLESIEILNFSTKRLMQTVSDYLDISLITLDNMDVVIKDFEPGVVIDEVQKQYYPLCLRKKVSLIIERRESFSSVILSSDKGLLKKIITNLIDNALKYTNEGSITLGVTLKINFIEFYIKDTGIGISKEAISIIFEHFSQEDVFSTKMKDSSGLGLAIVKGLVNLLGGKIRVESEEGVGSTFTFTIPWVVGSDYIEMPLPSIQEVPDTIRPIILVAEDEPYGFLLFELSLNEDFEIIRAEDGAEAIEICKLIPEIQLVLMDLKMPKMNGLTATQQIKKFRPDLPVIALTGYAEAGIREKCLEARCDEFISKPIGKLELLNKIQGFLLPK